MPATSARAPGKTILFGEHAVVYGYPGIAVPINTIGINISVFAKPDQKSDYFEISHTESQKSILYTSLHPEHPTRAAIDVVKNNLYIDHFPPLELRITSTIPNSAGLGSSAAFSVALVRAMSRFLGFNLSNERINEIAYEIEKIQHGTPSGIDNTVITYEKPVYFVRQTKLEFLKLNSTINLIIADSGIRTPTKQVVAELRKQRDSEGARIDKIFTNIHEIVDQAKRYLVKTNTKELGKLMNENHVALMELGVSCDSLDHLRDTALRAGAYGAKMCGGGKGGIISALASDNLLDKVRESLLENGAVLCFTTLIGSYQRGD